MIKAVKTNDTTPNVTIGSRADQYLRTHKQKQYTTSLRPGLRLPAGLNTNNSESIVKQFQLKGIGFGNWVTLEDRLNYQSALTVAFYDLNKVLRFDYNLGFSKNLTVTFGDRGMAGSLAHYNPNNILININRYSRGDDDKDDRFLNTGGIHSFSHEYGHYLDFMAGSLLEPDPSMFSLSNGHSIARSKTERKTPMRVLMDTILDKIIWKKTGELTAYYANLVKLIDDENNQIGDYWVRRTEIFARTFESYIQLQLNEMGIKDLFLTKLSYKSWAYPDHKLLLSIVPEMDKLIGLIRKKIVK